MNGFNKFPGGIWLIDCLSIPLEGMEGNTKDPLCMAGLNILTGESIRLWQDQLQMLKMPPFPTDKSVLIVAYEASDKLGLFIQLGWPQPQNILDIYAEFRCLTNGTRPRHGNSLNGALLHFGLGGFEEQKNDIRYQAKLETLRNGLKDQDLVDRCLSHVYALGRLWEIMKNHIDLPRALLRGEYTWTVAKMESVGVPIDIALLTEINSCCDSITEVRLPALKVGEDGRNRTSLLPFRSITGRNQPSSNEYIFGVSSWLRSLIRPRAGYGLAIIDWSQQEFGIAAALSSDERMMDAYASKDPYLAFAKQAGAIPAHATKQSHAAVRDQFKACALAIQYGICAESLAIKINQPTARARQLINWHRKTYQKFWNFSDSSFHEAILTGRLITNFGWQIQVCGSPNEKSLRNFPIQACGAEMLQIACVLLNRAGILVCAPIHDAILIESPLNKLNADVDKTQQLMREASRIVLGGFELSTDVQIVRYPDRLLHEHGIARWNSAMKLINEHEHLL